MAAAPEITAAHTPNAAARCRPRNTAFTVESVEGMMNAAPTAWTARAPISMPPARGRRRDQAAVDEPGEEESLTAPPVREIAGGEQQGGQQHGVEAVHPLRVSEVQVQVADDGGQGDAHDRAVEHDESQADREDGEADPIASALGGSGGLRRCHRGPFDEWGPPRAPRRLTPRFQLRRGDAAGPQPIDGLPVRSRA